MPIFNKNLFFSAKNKLLLSVVVGVTVITAGFGSVFYLASQNADVRNQASGGLTYGDCATTMECPLGFSCSGGKCAPPNTTPVAVITTAALPTLAVPTIGVLPSIAAPTIGVLPSAGAPTIGVLPSYGAPTSAVLPSSGAVPTSKVVPTVGLLPNSGVFPTTAAMPTSKVVPTTGPAPSYGASPYGIPSNSTALSALTKPTSAAPTTGALNASATTSNNSWFNPSSLNGIGMPSGLGGGNGVTIPIPVPSSKPTTTATSNWWDFSKLNEIGMPNGLGGGSGSVPALTLEAVDTSQPKTAKLFGLPVTQAYKDYQMTVFNGMGTGVVVAASVLAAPAVYSAGQAIAGLAAVNGGITAIPMATYSYATATITTLSPAAATTLGYGVSAVKLYNTIKPIVKCAGSGDCEDVITANMENPLSGAKPIKVEFSTPVDIVDFGLEKIVGKALTIASETSMPGSTLAPNTAPISIPISVNNQTSSPRFSTIPSQYDLMKSN